MISVHEAEKLNLEQIEKFLLATEEVRFEASTRAEGYGWVEQYRKSHGLELGDALIASAALLNRAEFWTRNRKHYPMKELSFY